MADNNQVAQRQQTGIQRFNASITNLKTQEYLASVLGEKKNSFINNVTALVANDSKLQACAPMTVVYAALKATALDLPLDGNLGYAYVIPYNNTKAGTQEAQFQIGYKGIIQLALRSGQICKLNVTEVYKGEIKGQDFITGDYIFSRAPENERTPENIIGYVAYFKLVNGFEKMLYMSKEEMEAHALRYSQTYKSKQEYVKKSSKWTTDFDAMASKTVLKLLLSKYAPLSVEMQMAFKADQSIMRESAEDYNYDDAPEEQEIREEAIDEQKAEMRENPQGDLGLM